MGEKGSINFSLDHHGEQNLQKSLKRSILRANHYFLETLFILEILNELFSRITWSTIIFQIHRLRKCDAFSNQGFE